MDDDPARGLPWSRSLPRVSRRWRQRRFLTLDDRIVLPVGTSGSNTSISGWHLAALTAAIVLGWLAAVFLIDPVHFVIFHPQGKTGFEIFLALGQLFGALVIALSIVDATHTRMRWAAFALLILGIGALLFGYALPMMGEGQNPNTRLYGSLLVRTMCTGMMATGLVLARPPLLTRRRLVTILAMGGVAVLALLVMGDRLPELVRAPGIDALLATGSDTAFPLLTGWHLILSLVPLTAGIVASIGAVAQYQRGGLDEWLVVGVILLAGSQLHSVFWPSMYSSILTTTSVLRFGLTVTIIVGGVLELRRISLERAALLAMEQERVRQLEELGQLKRDFTAMVAHELASPLAAISTMAQMLSLGMLPVGQHGLTADRIQGEARIIQLLIQDMQASADVERNDFSVHPVPVSLLELFNAARAYGEYVKRGHHLMVEEPDDVRVRADPERIGQVIRNLLNNAVRHTPEGTRIVLRARRQDGHIRVEVEDNGPGIEPADKARIFEKFARGRIAGSEGRGLGLYLSRRILQAHGSDLVVASSPGNGARFGFTLEEAP